VDKSRLTALAIITIMAIVLFVPTMLAVRAMTSIQWAPLTPQEQEQPFFRAAQWVYDTITFWHSPSSEEVVLAFKEQGLEVGAFYPFTSPGLVPQTYTEATRFEIPSLGPDEGGRVFVFESREDLAIVREYYTGLGEASPLFYSHVYEDGRVLVQISGELPKMEADRYGEVLEREV
jgi:hypothetical protein